MQTRQFIHEYSGYDGAKSECRLTFHKTHTGATVCVADELPTNSGTPVRDFSEHLATQAYRMLFPPNGLHLHEFLYIEHGPPAPHAREYSYSLLDFDWDENGMQFIRPRRTDLTEEEVATLLGEKE